MRRETPIACIERRCIAGPRSVLWASDRDRHGVRHSSCGPRSCGSPDNHPRHHPVGRTSACSSSGFIVATALIFFSMSYAYRHRASSAAWGLGLPAHRGSPCRCGPGASLCSSRFHPNGARTATEWQTFQFLFDQVDPSFGLDLLHSSCLSCRAEGLVLLTVTAIIVASPHRVLPGTERPGAAPRLEKAGAPAVRHNGRLPVALHRRELLAWSHPSAHLGLRVYPRCHVLDISDAARSPMQRSGLVAISSSLQRFRGTWRLPVTGVAVSPLLPPSSWPAPTRLSSSSSACAPTSAVSNLLHSAQASTQRWPPGLQDVDYQTELRRVPRPRPGSSTPRSLTSQVAHLALVITKAVQLQQSRLCYGPTRA